nr:beta-hexosaminidase [Quercus suber]
MTSSPVWPSPAESSFGDMIVWICSDVPFQLHCSKTFDETAGGHSECDHNSWTEQIREEFGHLLFDHPLVPEKLHPVHHDFEPSIRSRRETIKDFTLNFIETQADDLTANIDEAYTLRLAIEDGEWRVMCTATSFSGAYYALQILRQLFYKHSQSTQLELYSPFVPAIVRDKPRFVHRGLNVDIARNRIGPKDILARKGAYHLSQIWTCGDLAIVQKHGRRRAVELYLEIDMPALALLSHRRGDEINAKAYELDPGVGSSSHDAIRPALQALVDVALAQIKKANLTPLAWEEILLDWNISMPKKTIIQVWQSHDRLVNVLQKGHRAIFGPSTHWYLDAGHGSWVDPQPGNADTTVEPPFTDWCSPYKSWRQICSYNPFEDVPGDLHHLIHGGETHLWTELTDSVTLDSKLWPRAAAAAETLWAGSGKVDEAMTRRLAEFRERLVLQELGAAMVQMEWSLHNIGSSLL